MAFNKTKESRINVDQHINMIEKWFTEHAKRVKSTYKVLNSDSKSTQLTISTQFNNILKKMRVDTKDCKLLNSLSANSQLKIKNNYLSDNNINALSIDVCDKDIPMLEYSDIKNIIQNELSLIKKCTKLDNIKEELKNNSFLINTNLDIIYNKIVSTKEVRRNFIDKHTDEGQKIYEELYRCRHVYSTSYTKFAKEPYIEMYGISKTSILLNFITQQVVITEIVDKISKSIKDFIGISKTIFKDNSWFDDHYPKIKEIREELKNILSEDDAFFNLVRDIVHYYDQSSKELIEIIEFTSLKETSVKDVLKRFEKWDANSLINMLAVIESLLKFFNKFIKLDGEKNYANTNGVLKSISNILIREDMIGHLLIRVICYLNVSKYISGISGLYFGNSMETYSVVLNKSYKKYLESLFKSEYREQCKIGKIGSKLFNKHYTAVEIEEFVNLFKKQMIVNNIVHDIRIVEGPLISYYYNRLVYINSGVKNRRLHPGILDEMANRIVRRSIGLINTTESMNVIESIDNTINANLEGGSLGFSCMRYPQRMKRTKFYAENPKIYKMLIALTENKELAARAMLEYGDDGTVYLDRVYASNEKVRLEMFAWAEQRGFISIHTTNGTYKNDMKFKSDKNLVFELKEEVKDDDIPFLDSMILQSNIGIVSKKDISEEDKIKLENKLIARRVKEKTGSSIALLDKKLKRMYRLKSSVKDTNYKLSKGYGIKANTKLNTEVIQAYSKSHEVWGHHVKVPEQYIHSLTINFFKLPNERPLPVFKNRFKLKLEKKGLTAEDLFLRGTIMHNNITVLPDNRRTA